MIKRIALFLATNLAVILVLSIVLRLLGVDSVLDESGAGIDYQSLLILSLVIGFGGSFISLAMSKWMAKRATGARVITQPAGAAESWLLATVERQARQAGIDTPEVAIYDAPDMNAFATGARRNAALVAVSTGLLRGMPKEEVEAVLAHEVSHVANGDMVTLTLVQGVVNTFVIFLARIIGVVVDRAVDRDVVVARVAARDREGGRGFLIGVVGRHHRVGARVIVETALDRGQGLDRSLRYRGGDAHLQGADERA